MRWNQADFNYNAVISNINLAPLSSQLSCLFVCFLNRRLSNFSFTHLTFPTCLETLLGIPETSGNYFTLVRKIYWQTSNVKGIVHPWIKIQASFIHPHVVLNLYHFLSFVRHEDILKNVSIVFVHRPKVSGGQNNTGPYWLFNVWTKKNKHIFSKFYRKKG